MFSKYKLFATSYDLPSVRSDHKGIVPPQPNDQSIELYRNPKYRPQRNFWMMRRELDVQHVQELQNVVRHVQELQEFVQDVQNRTRCNTHLFSQTNWRNLLKSGRTGTSGCCTGCSGIELGDTRTFPVKPGRTGTSGCTRTELGATRTFPVKPIVKPPLKSLKSQLTTVPI